MRKLVIGLAVLLMAGSAYGTNWDGGGGADHDWTTVANWVGDAAPGIDNKIMMGYADITTSVTGMNRIDIKDAALNLTSGGTLDLGWGMVLNETDGGGSAGTFNWAGTMHAAGRGPEFYSPFLYNYSGSGTCAVNISGSASGGFWWWQIGRDADTVFTVSMTGSNTSIGGYYIQLDNNSEMKYIFDATGVSPITLSGSGVAADAAIELDADLGPAGVVGADLVLDLGAYTGGDATFTLLAGPTGALKVGEVFNSVTIDNAGGYAATVNYGDGVAGTGDVTVDIVPEPATLALLGLGGLGLLLKRRRR